MSRLQILHADRQMSKPMHGAMKAGRKQESATGHVKNLPKDVKMHKQCAPQLLRNYVIEDAEIVTL